MQFGASVQLELLEIRGLYGEQGTPTIGLGELKALRRLLDVVANLVGNFLQPIAHSHARVEIHPHYYHREEHGSRQQPAAQTVDGERHPESSLAEEVVGQHVVSSHQRGPRLSRFRFRNGPIYSPATRVPGLRIRDDRYVRW